MRSHKHKLGPADSACLCGQGAHVIINRLNRQRDQLLEAAKALVNNMPGYDYDPSNIQEYKNLKAAIARAEGSNG